MTIIKPSTWEKDTMLRIFAWGLYGFSVALMVLTLFLSPSAFPSTLWFGGIFLFTPPLVYTAIPAAVGLAMEYGKTTNKKLLLALGLSMLPIIVLLIMPDASYAIFSSVVLFVIIVTLHYAKLIPVRWPFIVLLGLIIAVTALLTAKYRSIYNSDALRGLVAVLITRGKSDPDGLGYERILMDKVLSQAKIIGACDFYVDEHNLSLCGHLIRILSHYGWLALGVVDLGYIAIVVLLIYLTRKTKGPVCKAICISGTTILTMEIIYAFVSAGCLPAVRQAVPFLNNHLFALIVSTGLLLTVICSYTVDKRMRFNII